MKRNRFQKLMGIIVIIMILWTVMMGIDYRTTMHGFNKSIFARPVRTADDGGSGIYAGIGYSFDIKGNFMPEDEFSGVTHGRFYLFGQEVKNSTRD